METQTTTQDIVFYQNNTTVTSSRLIAEKFSKRHSDVIKAIKNLEMPQDFSVRNFAYTPYINQQNNQEYPEYIITKDGFVLLVMGFTGKEAMKFKIEYINAFNSMEQALSYETQSAELSTELARTISRAAEIIGSLSKLSRLMGISVASLSLARKQGIMPNAKYKQSEEMIQRIEAICERITNGGIGYDRELTNLLLTINNRRARLDITQLLIKKAVL